MNSSLKWLIALAIVAGLALLGYEGVDRYLRRQREQARRTSAEPRIPRVRCVTIQKGSVQEIITITGSVQPMAEVQVSAKIAGRLERLRLEDGTPVDKGLIIPKAGVLVAVLDHAQWKADVAQAETAVATARAAVGVAGAGVEQAVAVREDADREYKRIKGLHDAGSTTDQALDQATGALDRARAGERVARAGVVQAEAVVAQAQAALARAQVMLDEASIKAPIAGVVSRKFLDEGSMVAPGTPIVTITDMDRVKIIAAANERDAARLRPNETRGTIRVDGQGTPEVNCTLCRIGVISDPVTHTVEVEAQIANPGHKLRPGAFARVDVTLGVRSGVPLVPDNAVMHRLGETFVFLFEGGKVHRRSVRLGRSQEAMTPVLDGLAGGEIVIVSQQQTLNEGDAVELDNPPAEGKGGSR